MIAYIKGEIVSAEADKIIIDNGNIGYNIFVPATLLSRTGGIGSEAKIFTYLNVKEDAMTLFGFLTKEELDLFKLILGVNGIGPKGALGILSVLSPDDLRVAVMSEDSKAIAKAPGIGNKTAMKLILELRDKLSIEDILSPSNNEIISADNQKMSEVRNEALQAMVALGYSQTESMKAVKAAPIDENTEVEDVIKFALKSIL